MDRLPLRPTLVYPAGRTTGNLSRKFLAVITEPFADSSAIDEKATPITTGREHGKMRDPRQPGRATNFLRNTQGFGGPIRNLFSGAREPTSLVIRFPRVQQSPITSRGFIDVNYFPRRC